VDQQPEPAQRRLSLEPGDEVVGQCYPLERRAEHELARMENERLVAGHLDELRQLFLLRLDVDEGVARVAEDPEERVDANVEARRLHEARVVGIDPDPPGLDQPADGSVGEHHRRGS
jgi:hypothetical protein